MTNESETIKEHPDFNEWLKTEDGLSSNDINTLAEQKYLTNRLFWAFDAGRNCVWDQYLELKKEINDYKIAQDGNLRKLDELNEWKRSSIEVHGPLYEYMQGPAGTALGLRAGDRIIEKTIEILKKFESLNTKP